MSVSLQPKFIRVSMKTKHPINRSLTLHHLMFDYFSIGHKIENNCIWPGFETGAIDLLSIKSKKDKLVVYNLFNTLKL